MTRGKAVNRELAALAAKVERLARARGGALEDHDQGEDDSTLGRERRSAMRGRIAALEARLRAGGRS